MTDGHKRPKVDKQEDWTVTSLSEINGTTTMEFNRKQNTSDAEGDNVIGVSSLKQRTLSNVSKNAAVKPLGKLHV